MTTFHYDNARSGLNPSETVLTTSNVNSAQFGKLFSTSVDGYVYAQPLYLAHQTISGVVHNVLYVATEHDSVYAIDADNGAVLWQRSFINAAAGITTVSNTDEACDDLVPEIGITSTPVIDPVNGILYTVAKTKENGSYVQRLHALSVTTGSELLGGPVTITATYQGRTFGPFRQANRPGLLLENGHVVIAWASHCDNSPYQGWVISYNASNLSQEAVLNTEPDASGFDGGIWMSGDGVAADTSGNLYFATGNGDNDLNHDYGDSVMKLSGPTNGAFTVQDWFTPQDQSTLSSGDTDLGAGGVLLLPDLPAGSAHQQMLVAMGKQGKIYLIDRNNMGKFCSACTSTGVDTNIVQEIPGATGGVWGSPVFWNNRVYWGGSRGPEHAKAWSFNSNNSGLLSTSPVSLTTQSFGFVSSTPVISANGTSNGIFWLLDNSTSASSCCQVLYAFDATNLGTTLYTSNQAANSRDVPGGAVKFTSPVVVNGKVYVGSQKTVSGFGILSNTPTAATPTFSPAPGTYSSTQSVMLSDTTAGAAIHYTLDGSTPSASSTTYTSAISVASSTTIKAIAIASGFTNSAVATGVYTITTVAATPTFSPAPGTYSSTQSVTLSDTTPGATIHYTLDGSTPSASSTTYTSAITVASSTTIKAIAIASGFTNSAVATGVYTITTVAATPTFSPAPGTYSSTQSVMLSDTTPGAAIHYTLDGSTPSASSTTYTSAITVASSTTIKAIAIASGFTNSAVATGVYTITAASSNIDFGGGFSATGMALNGTAALSGTRLRLTSGLLHQAGSGFFSTPVNVQSFTTDFSFQITKPVADGMAFVIQNIGATALGPSGGGLAYSGIGKSIAVKFDLYSNNGEGANSTGLYINGAAPTVPAVTLGGGVNLHSGDVFNVHITYDGGILTMTITDAGIPADTFTTSWSVNIPSIVGANSAFAGFTGGTGGAASIQDVVSWTFTSTSPPGTKYEAESLSSTGAPDTRIVAWSFFSNGEGVIVDATQVGNNLAFTVNVPQAGIYDVKYAAKLLPFRGIGQLAFGGTNVGPAIDQYNPNSNGVWQEFDVGNVSIPAAGSYQFTFTVTGKNASSTGYSLTVDYIKLTPQ